MKYRIGRYEIELPHNHSLPRLQKEWGRYDRVLGEIANIIREKYSYYTAIDIGANVGDTAALICNKHDIDILCIEGSGEFLNYLQKNVKILNARIEIEENYISETHTLIDCLESHPHYKFPKLIKIDTDGYDFNIINSSIKLLKDVKPVLYFEYYVNENNKDISLQAISNLATIGYDTFIVYDNFGNLLTTIRENYRERFAELNNYLFSNIRNRIVVHYFDVCVINKDEEIANQIKEQTNG